MNYALHMISTQTEKAKAGQVKNNAGGFVFKLDPFQQLSRFLILGSDSNTYYQTARALTRENAQVVLECWKLDPQLTLKTIVDVSHGGRAPKNDPAIFALALGTLSEDIKVRQMVYGSLFQVCRTATHVFMFINFCQTLGKGWGRGLKNAIGSWYANTPVDRLALQMVKYRNRHDFTHKRLLQTSHPKVSNDDNARRALVRWAVDKDYNVESLPVIVQDFMDAQKEGSDVHEILKRNPNLPWEALPTHSLNDARTWVSLLPGMGTTALIRNLAKMSSVGVLKALSREEAYIVGRLTDKERILKDRIHPMNLLFAMKTYGAGRGFRGDNQWEVNREVLAALEQAYYLAFGNLPQGKKRTYIGLDVSGSMSALIMNSNVSCREAAAAMSMVTIKSEPQVIIRGFTASGRDYYSRKTGLEDLGITRNDSLKTVNGKVQKANFGSTDCSLPILDAMEKGLEVDQFVIYTDNETYAGKGHPYKVLQDYRKKSGINAKCVVVGMTSTGFSIADPSDPGMLDVVGFDTSAPTLIADF